MVSGSINIALDGYTPIGAKLTDYATSQVNPTIIISENNALIRGYAATTALSSSSINFTVTYLKKFISNQLKETLS